MKELVSFINITNIFDCFLIIISTYIVISEFIKMDKDKKAKILLSSLDSIILDIMSNSEIEWQDVPKSGQIKRSHVIKTIFENYPILENCKDQEYVINTIDKCINACKPIMDSILNNKSMEFLNSNTENEVTNNGESE